MPFRLYQAVPPPDESSTAYADGFAGACGFGGTVLGCGRYCGCAGCATRGAIGVGDAGCGGAGYRFCAGRLVAL